MHTEQYHATVLEDRIARRLKIDWIPAEERIEDRLFFDWGLMPTKQWAQMDNTEGLWCGMWTNPFERLILMYHEGDIAFTECADDAEYVGELTRIITWEQEQGTWVGIDPGFDAVREKLIERGAGPLLAVRRSVPLASVVPRPANQEAAAAGGAG